MPQQSDNASKFQEFVQSLLNPKPGDPASLPNAPNITISRPVRCKFFINYPPGHTPPPDDQGHV